MYVFSKEINISRRKQSEIFKKGKNTINDKNTQIS